MSTFSPYELIDVQIIESNMAVDIELLEHPASDERPLLIHLAYMPLAKDSGHIETNAEERRACELRLSVEYDVYHEKIKGSRKKPRPVVKLKVVLRGLITALFAEDVGENEQDYLLRVNATSLLYAEARAHIIMLTAQSPVGKVILPPVDPYSIVDETLEALS